MILRGQIPKDQLLFEAEIERESKETERQKQKRSKETLERNPQPLLLFPLIFFRRKVTWQKSKHHVLGGHLEIMPCSRGQGIFLVFQYLLPTRPWR